VGGSKWYTCYISILNWCGGLLSQPWCHDEGYVECYMRKNWIAREIFEEISVSSTWTHDLGEEAQSNSGRISIGSELSSLNFNSSVRAEQSFVIRYPIIVIKSLCITLDICLNHFAKTPTIGCGILFACLWYQTATESERCFFKSRFRSRSWTVF